MALPLQRTLGELRGVLQARLGFGNQGAPSLIQRTILNDFLLDAQEDLYWRYKLGESRTLTPVSVVSGQTLYDWPDNVDPLRRILVRVLVDTRWIPLEVGIESADDSILATTTGYPRRYDVAAQLEIWPTPDATYSLEIEGYPRLGSFTDDADRASMPDPLVFKLALIKGKLHYRHPDAEEALRSFEGQLSGRQSAENIDRRYVRRPRAHRRRAPEEPYGIVPPRRV